MMMMLMKKTVGEIPKGKKKRQLNSTIHLLAWGNNTNYCTTTTNQTTVEQQLLRPVVLEVTLVNTLISATLHLNSSLVTPTPISKKEIDFAHSQDVSGGDCSKKKEMVSQAIN
jgi:hypothetical protein